MTRMPPVPPANRSSKGPGSDPTVDPDTAPTADQKIKDRNLEQQGRHGNINQNTHHQGYQQDR